MARTNYFRTFTLLVAVAAAVVVALMMSIPAWAAASKVFVTEVSPDGGATSVAADSDITATFDKDMRASTIKGTTFYLKKQGSSKTIPASVFLDTNETSRTATLNPESNLEADATYTAYIKGGRRGVKASDGGRLGGTTDSTATFANGKVTWSFTVAAEGETTPPPPPPPPPPPVDACPYQPGDQPEGTVCTEGLVISPSSLTHFAQVPWKGDCRIFMVGNPFLSKLTLGDPELHNYTGDVMWFGEASLSGPDAQYFNSASKDYIKSNGPFGVASTEYVVDRVWMQFDPAVSEGTRTYNATLTYKDLSGNTLGSVPLRVTTECDVLVLP